MLAPSSKEKCSGMTADFRSSGAEMLKSLTLEIASFPFTLIAVEPINVDTCIIHTLS